MSLSFFTIRFLFQNSSGFYFQFFVPLEFLVLLVLIVNLNGPEWRTQYLLKSKQGFLQSKMSLVMFVSYCLSPLSKLAGGQMGPTNVRRVAYRYTSLDDCRFAIFLRYCQPFLRVASHLLTIALTLITLTLPSLSCFLR